MAKLTSALPSAHTAAAMRWLILACLILAVLFGSRSAQAQERADAVEGKVKAAYLFKFGGYVDWPDGTFASADSPLTIGVIGADAMADELAQLAVGRTINGRPVAVRKLRRDEPVAGLHVLFIGRAGNSRLADILAAAKGQPLLTVTESEDALAYGSMINFVIVDGKLRFEVAPKTAGLGKLNISARLLAAAHKVAPGAS